MAPDGIGERLKRKEDQRFLTGKGRYTDDISRPGQVYGYVVRSPHAHARITGYDTAAVMEMPGVLAVLTGEDVKADGLGGLPAGWMIHSKDGSPMKAPVHPILADGNVRYVGDPVAFVVAETWPRRATPAKPSWSITRNCRPTWPSTRRRTARSCSTTCRTTSATTGRSATRRRPTRHSRARTTSPRFDIVNNPA